MKKKWLAVLSFVLLVVLCAFVGGADSVWAKLTGSGNDNVIIYDDPESGPVTPGCPQTYDTCYGLTWRWYPWPEGANEVTIPGSSNKNYLSITISGRAAEVCKATKGYYRYAFVNRSTGEQWGTMSLAAHTEKNMRTQMIVGDGGAHYRGEKEGGVRWETVKAAYMEALSLYPDVVPANGFENGSGLRVFCAKAPGDTPTVQEASCSSYTPASYNQNQTSIITKVRNRSTNGSWGDTAFVGVGQKADWMHCYYPGVQKYASKKVSTIDEPGDWTCSTLMPHTVDYTDDGRPLYWQSQWTSGDIKITSNDYTFNNSPLYTVTTWQNFFTISRNSVGSFNGSPAGGSYVAGISNIQEKHSYHDVDGSNVSGTLTETATTGTPTSVSINTTAAGGIRWACGYQYRWTAANGVEPEGCNGPVACGGHYDRVKDKCKKCHKVYKPNGSYDYNCTDLCEEWSYKNGDYIIDYCNPGDPGYPDDMVCRTHYDTYSDNRAVNFWNGTEYVTWSTNAPTTASSSASVQVPINYAISGNISLTKAVFAGETASIQNGIISNTGKWNGATGNAYATYAGDVKYKLISYVSDKNDTENNVVLDNNLCAGKSYCSASDVISAGGIGANSSKAVLANQFGTLHVPDVKAGNYFCVALAYYPTNSGSDTNLGNWNGNGQWGSSTVNCQVIMKKPTMQVWGASVYSAGKIATSTSTKNNLGGAGYTQSGAVSSANIFGSWAEQAVVSLGQVSGLASGAAISKGIKANPSGVYCKYFVPLSFANNFGDSTGCPGGQASGSMANNVSNIIADREGLVNKVAPMTGVSQVSSTNNIDISRPASYQEVNSQNGRKVRVTYSANSLSLAGANLTKGITHVVRSNGTITINSDITYDNDGYTEMGQVPKLIIFANGSINIKCNVSRIDAVLIANGNVNTCSDSSDVHSEKNSKQLKINGTVITNRLIARRTYGNATGANSAVPAEIINYDSSIILWSSVETDTSGTDTVNVTYQHELAPRY